MPAQDPLSYRRKKSRGSGPQGSGLDPHGPKSYLISDTRGKDWQVRESGRRKRTEDSPGYNSLAGGNRRVGNNAAGRIARGQALKRKTTSTPNMGKVVRTLWGPNGPIERTYQRPFGSRRTFSTNGRKKR